MSKKIVQLNEEVIKGEIKELNSLVSNEEYSIEKAIVFSNRREIRNKGKIVYLPIYYVSIIVIFYNKNSRFEKQILFLYLLFLLI